MYIATFVMLSLEIASRTKNYLQYSTNQAGQVCLTCGCGGSSTVNNINYLYKIGRKSYHLYQYVLCTYSTFIQRFKLLLEASRSFKLKNIRKLTPIKIQFYLLGVVSNLI